MQCRRQATACSASSLPSIPAGELIRNRRPCCFRRSARRLPGPHRPRHPARHRPPRPPPSERPHFPRLLKFRHVLHAREPQVLPLRASPSPPPRRFAVVLGRVQSAGATPPEPPNKRPSRSRPKRRARSIAAHVAFDGHAAWRPRNRPGRQRRRPRALDRRPARPDPSPRTRSSRRSTCARRRSPSRKRRWPSEFEAPGNDQQLGVRPLRATPGERRRGRPRIRPGHRQVQDSPLNLQAAEARQSMAAKNVGDGVIRHRSPASSPNVRRGGRIRSSLFGAFHFDSSGGRGPQARVQLARAELSGREAGARRWASGSAPMPSALRG